MYTRTHRFEEYKVSGQKSGKCEGGCGKRIRRQTTFTETQNPFNKNAAGQVKTVAEIYESLKAKRDAWVNKPVWCEACLESA